MKPLPGRPRIDPRFAVRVERNGILLLCESGETWLAGDTYPLLAPRLHGEFTVPEIVDATDAPVAETLTALVLLDDAGYLSPGQEAPTPPSIQPGRLKDAEFALLGAPASYRGPGTLSIASLALDPEQATAVELAAGTLGLSAHDDSGDAPVLVVASNDLHPDVAALSDRFAGTDRSWLPVQPFGFRPWVGPLIAPANSCWRCLSERLRANRAIETCLDLALPRPWSDESVAWMLSFALRRTPLLDDSAPPVLTDHLLDHRVVVDFEHSRITTHRAARSPQCRHHDRSRAVSGKHRASFLQLTSERRTRAVDGGHRREPAEETLGQLEAFVDPVTGPVRSIERIEGEEKGLSVFVAAAAYPGRVSDWTRLRRRLRARCAGKGRSDVQARVSALAEAVERYSGFQRPDDPVRVASFRDLGDQAIDPRSCLLFSERQYEHRDAWNTRDAQSNWVPHPFDDDEPIEWTPLWSLRDETERFLPTAWCYYDPLTGPSRYCRSDSNGAAAGSCSEEAILQGFLEVVERDAGALWWYSRVRRPPVDWPDHDGGWTSAVRSRLEALDRDAWLLDLTADLGIPVVVAVSRRRERTDDDLLLGFGAHLDPRLAAERALAELCQFLVTDAAKNGNARTEAARTGKEQRIFHHTADVLDWLEPRENAPTCPPRSGLINSDLAAEVRRCVSLGAEHGLDTLVLRQTRHEAPLEVVKVVVPHLRPWWPRFAPGRLFDVPVELGWIDAPLDEEALNPIPLLI